MVGVPLGSWISYQRTPVVVPAVTLWFTTSDSWSPKFRYARRYMSRSPRESSFCVVPDCGTHAPPPLHAGENAATPATEVGPRIHELLMFAQSTWSLQSRRLLDPKLRKNPGSPAGGGV